MSDGNKLKSIDIGDINSAALDDTNLVADHFDGTVTIWDSNTLTKIKSM